MFTTQTPRQTREKAPRIASNHGKENTRADSTDAPQAIVGGSRAIVEGNPPRQGTVSRPPLAPTGRGIARFSRHVFWGVFWLLVVIFAEIRENLRGVWAFFRP